MKFFSILCSIPISKENFGDETKFIEEHKPPIKPLEFYCMDNGWPDCWIIVLYIVSLIFQRVVADKLV